MNTAKPLVGAFKSWSEKQIDAVLPKCSLVEALCYMLNHWKALDYYLDEGFFKPGNNKAEQHIWP